MARRASSSIQCPWAGTLLPPRTMEALVSQFDHDGSGRFDLREVNAAISLFNTLDHLEHINGGKASSSPQQQPKMGLCSAGPEGMADKYELTKVMQEFADGPIGTTVPNAVHVFQELHEIEWVFVMWAGSKSSTLAIHEMRSVLDYFNTWSTPRHESAGEGKMTMSYYDPPLYGAEINFPSFTRWVWEELSRLEETFSEPFELTLGKLSECVEEYNMGAEVGNLPRTKERCPWSGLLLPPRTLGAWLASFSKDASGRFEVEEINAAIALFNSLDNLEHLRGGKATLAARDQCKIQLCTGGPDGKVSETGILATLQTFNTVALGGDAGSSLGHVIHAFQELQEIEWLFVTFAGNRKGALDAQEVALASKNFNKWAMKRHDLDPRGLMAINIYDVSSYGPEINLLAFTRWVWEELSTMEELFSEPLELMLQILADCMQSARVTTCFRTWDTTSSSTIDFQALVSVLSELMGDDAEPGQVQAILEKVDQRKDGKVDYPAFVEAIMLQQLGLDL